MAPTAHDTATKTDPPLQFIFEMVQHPTRVEIKDPHSGEVLAELDQATSEALLSEGGRPGPDSAAATLAAQVTGLFGPATPIASAPAGLASKALEQQFGAAAGEDQRKTRRKLWDLASKWHCPVIGTCLEASELRRIAHRAGARPGDLWATLTHPRCDNALRARVFEDVHMLSHQIGAGQRADLKRLDETEAALKQLQRDFDNRQRRQIEDREQQIDRLESALRSVREQLRTCQASESQLRQTVAELSASATVHKVEELRDTLSTREQQFAHVEHHANALQLAVGAAEQDVATLQQEHQDLAAECEAMERFIVEALSNDCEDCDELTCANHPDLGGRRILCVGGRARLIDQYRDMVTRCNGRFEHYDGGIEESRQRLDALLSSADAVVCATDSVSHDAYYRLKRFCKRADKPHVFMRNSGMSSFTRAIYGVAGRA